DRYMRVTGKTSHGGWRMIRKSLIIFAWIVASYLAMLFLGRYWLVAIPATISLGVAAAAVGFNIQHDAGHRSYTVGRRGNRIIAFSLDVMGASSFLWNIK